jgi:hypothetical protein
MNLDRDKAFEASLFLKRTGFRKEDHAPRHPVKQALLDDMFVEKARKFSMLRISDSDYVCRRVFLERLEKGTLPDNKWVKKSLARFNLR